MNDRCDRCGAEGKVRFVKDTQELVFCGHHTYEYGEKLEQAGFDGEDADQAFSVLVTA